MLREINSVHKAQGTKKLSGGHWLEGRKTGTAVTPNVSFAGEWPVTLLFLPAVLCCVGNVASPDLDVSLTQEGCSEEKEVNEI